MDVIGRESARAARSQSNDARSIRTQRQLIEAFSQIVRAEGYDRASASRIAREAGLSRSGFYEHFASVDDLGFFVLADLLHETTGRDVAGRTTASAPHQTHAEKTLNLLFTLILEDRDLYENILLSNSAGRIINRMMERFAHSAYPLVEFARPNLPAAQKDLYAAAIGGAILGAVMHCLRTDDRRTVQELTREVIEVLPTWM